MTKYRVYFTPDSSEQILSAYEWGVENWGRSSAQTWLRDLYTAIFRRLSAFPGSCAIAPESEEVGKTIRQLVFGRYRILYEVRDERVLVLRLTGPFNADR
jgi:plasmid stabilization system protein ParE